MIETGFEARLRELGFRVTPQRQLILETIGELGEHATFEQINEIVQSKSPSISPATIYRTLDLFTQLHLVYANEISGDKVYELASETTHHHLICRNCWSDQKIDNHIVKELAANVDRQYRFLLQSEHLVLLGLCSHCRQDQKAAS